MKFACLALSIALVVVFASVSDSAPNKKQKKTAVVSSSSTNNNNNNNNDGGDITLTLAEEQQADMAKVIRNRRTPTNVTSDGRTILMSESMSEYPTGWRVVNSGWTWGIPTSLHDPGHRAVVGNNLINKGFYPPHTHGMTLVSKSFSTVGYTDLLLNFDRFLGVLAKDEASISICLERLVNCEQIWVNSGRIVDTMWDQKYYSIPAQFENNPAVVIKFNLDSNSHASALDTGHFGWNIKQVVVTGV